MEPARKEIIVQEILLWKKSKMIPERYCEYLYSLYTEGELEASGIKARKNRKNVMVYFMMSLLIVTFVISSSFFFLTNVGSLLNYVVFTGVTIFQLGILTYFFQKPLYFSSSLMIFNFTLFLNLLFLLTKYSATSFATITVIAAFILGLFLQGKVLRLKLFIYMACCVCLFGMSYMLWNIFLK